MRPGCSALLQDLLPNAMTVAVLRNPNNAEQAGQPAELQDAARTLGLQLLVLYVTTPNEIDTAFATVVQERIGALIAAGDSFLWNQREQIMALAAQHAVPAIYGDREMAGAGAGGLMSYGNSSVDAPIAGLASIPRAFSRARSRLTCRSIRRQGSSW